MLFTSSLLAEFCSLILCAIIIITSYKKIDEKSSRLKLFNLLSWCLFGCILINIFRYAVLNIYLKYTFTLLFHIFNALIFYLFVMYSIRLTPINNKNYIKYKKMFFKIYIIFILVIISSPLTKLVYYIDNETIVRGPLAIISFIQGNFTVFSIIYIALIKQKTSQRIKNNILLILSIMILITLLELLFPSLIIHGFGYMCVHLLTYQSFHFNNYDFRYGISTDSLLVEKFYRFRKNKIDFSLIFLDILNIDFLIAHMPKEELTKYLFSIFRDCELLDFSPSIYKYNNKFAILLKDSKDANEFITYLKNQLDEKKPKKELNNLLYQITCFKSPFMISSLDEISYFSSDNQINYIDEKQFNEFKYKKALNKEIDDIFNLNNLSDPRIEVFYQPILDNEKKKFLSAEALSRLNLKDFGGLIYPDKFIPILEEKKYIHKYSMTVLNKVCFLINQLIFNNVEFEGISVNFSLQEFLEPNFENDVISIVEKNGVNPNRIHIEITESVEVTNTKLVKEIIQNLKEYGFKFYLDDFGTGYSNLSEIIEFPLDVIKFDKSLVWNSITDENIENLTNGMTDLLSKNFDILFEGVENETHEELAKKLNVKFSQGYKYYKPLKGTDILEVIGKKI